MNDNLFILIFIIILFTSLVYMYTILKKKEKFSSCKNIDSPIDGLCLPYYGRPDSDVINPAPNNAELNRQAAKSQCDNTPGCTGFFQNKKMQREAYLCKPEWNRSLTVPVVSDIYDFETYRCSNNNLHEGPGKNAGGNYDDIINLMDSHTNIYTRSLNKKHLSFYDNKVFNSDSIIFENSNEITKPILTMSLPYLALEEVMKMKIDQIIAEASLIDNCIGFTVFLKDGDSHVKFYQKVPNQVVTLVNKSTSETDYIVRSYYAKIVVNPVQALNLNNLKLQRNQYWGFIPFLKYQDFVMTGTKSSSQKIRINIWANNALLLFTWNDWGGTQRFNHPHTKPSLFLKTGDTFKRIGMHPSPGHGFDFCESLDDTMFSCWSHWVESNSKGTCIGLWWD